MLISFEKLIRKCIHKNHTKKFHNQIEKSRIKWVFTQIHAQLQSWGNQKFSQILNQFRSGEVKDVRELSAKEKYEKVSEFSHLGNHREIERFILNNSLWQFRIDNKTRVVGILERNYFSGKLKKTEQHNEDLFYILYYDFEHTSHFRIKKKFQEEDLICIMDENCKFYN